MDMLLIEHKQKEIKSQAQFTLGVLRPIGKDSQSWPACRRDDSDQGKEY